MRRLLSLLLLFSLALGGGVDCCMPELAAAGTPVSGGCHEMPQQNPADDAADHDPSGTADAAGCGSCTHCVTSAPMAVSARVALMLAPFDAGALRLAPAGLPPFAPPLRPPIGRVSAPPIF